MVPLVQHKTPLTLFYSRANYLKTSLKIISDAVNPRVDVCRELSIKTNWPDNDMKTSYGSRSGVLLQPRGPWTYSNYYDSSQQQALNEDNLRKQEESVQKQEAMRKGRGAGLLEPALLRWT